ncbi:hypothetical protein TNCV_4540251 [Trichonephila clavipes]|nr:hypothetical protein TNCV_4540251 [Trichonephila clavipes]
MLLISENASTDTGIGKRTQTQMTLFQLCDDLGGGFKANLSPHSTKMLLEDKIGLPDWRSNVAIPFVPKP